MRYFPVILWLFIFPVPISAQDIDCRKDLKEARELIDERWSFKIFKAGAFDLERTYKQLEPAAKRAETPAACADVLSRFMSHLNDGHSRLGYFPGLKWTRPDVEIRSQREMLSPVPGQAPPLHAYIVERDTTDEALRQIYPGSEIVAVDGEPINSVYERLEKRVSGSTPQWRDYMIDERLLAGPAGESVELEIREPSGRRRTITIQRPEWEDPDEEDDEEDDEEEDDEVDEEEVASWKRLEGGWGYLKYTTFAFEDPETTVELFDEALDSLIDAPGLIIDLRGNGGGYVSAIGETAGRFLNEKTVIGYYQAREPGQNAVIEMWDTNTGSVSTRMSLLAKPRKRIYEGPVVLLVDRECFSACESFAGGLQALGRALVVGSEATGGGSGYVGGLRLPSRAIISFSWTVAWLPDGSQIEGHGVKPTIRVRERPADWSSGRDRVLERAIKALEQQEAKPLVASEG